MPPRLPRPFPSTRIALLSGLAALAPCASAQLAWDTTEISAASPAPNRESELSFSFQNTGRSPVQIESVTHSCNCLRTQLSKHALAPGESGKLTAWVRTVGTPTERTVRLLVTTVQDPLHPVSLKIRLSPAASASLEPAVLWWPLDHAKPSPQSATLQLPKDASPPRITAPSSNPESFPFTWKLEPTRTPNRFELTVVPLSTHAPIQSQLAIAWDLPAPSPSPSPPPQSTLFLRIQPRVSPANAVDSSVRKR